MNCIITTNFLVLINGVAKNLVHLKKKIETRMSPLSLHFNYECKSVEDASAGRKLEPYP